MTFTIRCRAAALRSVADTVAAQEDVRATQGGKFLDYGNTTLLDHQFGHMLCFQPPLLTEQAGSQNGMTDAEFRLSPHSSGISETHSDHYEI